MIHSHSTDWKLLLSKLLRYFPLQFVIVGLCIQSTGSAQTYYVDATAGNDTWNGLTPATAWQTLTKVNAKSSFLAGDTIYFKSGCSWTGQLKPKGSGSAARPIVIDKYGGTVKPLIMGGGVTGQGTVYLTNQQYWEINNLEITNDAATEGDRRGVLITAANFGTVNHIYLRNLDIHNVKGIVGQDDAAKRTGGIGIETTADGTTATRYNDILIEGCTIYSCKNTGLYTDNVVNRSAYPQTSAWLQRRFTNVSIRNNIIHDIAKNAMIIRLFDKGVIEHNVCYETAQDTTGNTMYSISCDSTIFQYNEGYLNRSPGADGSMYDADLRSPNTIWQYSYSHDNAHGLFWTCTVQEDSGVICRYNISQNDKGNIFCINYPNTSVYCYNNTVFCGAGVSPTIISERNVNSGTRTYYFYNNIIYNNSSTATYDFKTSGYTRYIDYNVFYGTHPSKEPPDAHKLTSNPQFVNPGSGGYGITSVDGYKLQAGSPCLNSGFAFVNHASLDYWGNPVPSGSAVDRGAYESRVLPQYTLTVLATDGGVSRSPDQTTYDSSTSVQLTATPALGFHFLNWTGDLTGSENPATIVMNGNKTVTANFQANTTSTFLLWTGGAGDGLWSSPANWSTGVIPTSADTVVLDHSLVGDAYTVSVTAGGSSCKQLVVGENVLLSIDGSLATLTVGDSLSGNHDLMIEHGGTIKNLSTAVAGMIPFALKNNAVDVFRIEQGGTYYHNSPRGFSTPFPAAACSFDAGSTVEYATLSPVNPPLAGRTYGNLIFSSTTRKSMLASSSSSGFTILGTLTIDGDSLSFFGNWTSPNPITIASLVNNGDTLGLSTSSSPLSIGTVTNNGFLWGETSSSDISISGDIVNNGTWLTGSNQIVNFNGTSLQVIAGTGAMILSDGGTISNVHGVTSNQSIVVSGGTLALEGGIVELNGNAVVRIHTGAGITRTSGHIAGVLDRSLTIGSPVVLFPIGDLAGNYTPVEMNFSDVVEAGSISIKSVGSDHPAILTSGIEPTKSVNRYFAITDSGISFTDCSLKSIFVPGDIDGGADPQNFVARLYTENRWIATSAMEKTDTSILIGNVTAFGDLAIGEIMLPSSHDIPIQTGWNLVALPCEREDRSKNSLFPHASSNVFSYNDGYLVDDTLSLGVGYWVKYPAEETIDIVGTDIYEDSINLRAGWNLIGSISIPVSVASISVTPADLLSSEWFGYQRGYQSVDTLQPGIGYWVKAKQAGMIYIKAESLSLKK